MSLGELCGSLDSWAVGFGQSAGLKETWGSFGGPWKDLKNLRKLGGLARSSELEEFGEGHLRALGGTWWILEDFGTIGNFGGTSGDLGFGIPR